MADLGFEILERDEAGRVVATYIASGSGGGDGAFKGRVDVIKAHGVGDWWRWQWWLAIFLPSGYPHSVTEDYMWYQIYDSLQAFSSSIAGLLSSRAVLQGVGVGDATASPTTALLLSILQDSTGRLATILFAHKVGTALEPECKMWRLAADIFNDAAMVLDCLSPAFSKPVRVACFSFSSVLRALCGVAAGSSKASLSAHFARWDNLGELNAKDSSQETVISLLGMLAGSLVVSWVSSTVATWSCLMLLLSIHLAMNRAAVRAVSMRTLNRQRANLVISEYVSNGKVLTPQEVSAQERIFERDGILRWRGGATIGQAVIGGSLADLLKWAGKATVTGAVRDSNFLTTAMETFKDDTYMIGFDVAGRRAMIILKDQASPQDQLKAWAVALCAACRLQDQPLPIRASLNDSLELLKEIRDELSGKWTSFFEILEMKGWNTQISNLETMPGVRISLAPSSARH